MIRVRRVSGRSGSGSASDSDQANINESSQPSHGGMRSGSALKRSQMDAYSHLHSIQHLGLFRWLMLHLAFILPVAVHFFACSAAMFFGLRLAREILVLHPGSSIGSFRPDLARFDIVASGDQLAFPDRLLMANPDLSQAISRYDAPKPVRHDYHDPLACEWDLALRWNFTSDGPLKVPAGDDGEHDEDAGVKIGRHEILIRPNAYPDPRQLVVSQSLLRLLQENERLRLLAKEDGRLSSLPPRRVIVITPTYKRTFQQLHTLGLINSLKRIQAPLLWVVVEATKTEETARLIGKASIGDSGSENPEVEIAHLGVEEEMPEDWDERVLLEQRMRVVGLRYVRERLLDGLVVFADDGSVFSPSFFAEAQRVRWFGAGSVGVLLPGGFTQLMGSEGQAEEQGEGVGKSKGQREKQRQRHKHRHGHGKSVSDVEGGSGGGERGGERGADMGQLTLQGQPGEGGLGKREEQREQLQLLLQQKLLLQKRLRQQQEQQEKQGKQDEGEDEEEDEDERRRLRLLRRRLLQTSSQSAPSKVLTVGKQMRYQMPVQGPVCNNESALIGWHAVVHHPDRLLSGLPSYNSLGSGEEQRRGMLWHGYVFNSRILWARKEELPDWLRGWDEWGAELERGLEGGLDGGSEGGLIGGSEDGSEGGSEAGLEGRLFDLLGAVVQDERHVQLLGQCGRHVLVWWWRAEARQDSKFPSEWVISPQLPITVRAKSTPWPDPMPPPPPSPPSPPPPPPPRKGKKGGGKKKGRKHKNSKP
ncbi:hypothetical protein CLOM_g7430 [Closterium sp. NIES-68]|nr:hypothetical protein CLOM_g7430 [Closterium sp. NIES-68]GJP83696.1 hypothetical protein CLOP_g13822 [Closterium sp. NIES-67]